VLKNFVIPILAIAFTDLALQLDNAIAISSVAAQLPTYRLPVLAGGVLLAALCLLSFTLVGSYVIERITWVKVPAGLVLVGLGVKLVLDFVRT
jgi:predicted tellurium resistance membrane protein TerC